MNISLNNLPDLLRHWMVDTTPVSLAIQYAALFILTALTIYGILFMRRRNVIIISQGQIFMGIVIASLLNLGIFHLIFSLGLYRGVFGLSPTAQEWWKSLLFIVLIFIAFTFWRYVLDFAVFCCARNSLRDLHLNPSKIFNCNWPLISRCANFCLFEITLISYSLLTLPR